MSFFVTKADGAYSLTTAGYVAVAVILVAFDRCSCAVCKTGEREKKRKLEQNSLSYVRWQLHLRW